MRRRLPVALVLVSLVSFGFASPLLVLAGAAVLVTVWLAVPELRSKESSQ